VTSSLSGINQTVLLALDTDVIATLVGAGGLYQEIRRTAKLLSHDHALLVGLVFVAVAEVLNRIGLLFIK